MVFSPDSIFYIPYVTSSLVLTLIWLIGFEKLNLLAALKLFFSPRIWWNRSTLIDLVFCVLNLGVLASIFNWSRDLAYGLVMSLPQYHLLKWNFPELLQSLCVTLVTMLCFDLASYGMHFLMHKNRWIWKIHSFHHSAEVLTPLTTYRQNPAEIILLNTARSLAAGLGLIICRGFLSVEASVITVFGLGLGFFLYMFTVNLHHSMVPIRYPRWIRSFLISPHVHHLHHSRDQKHRDCNFGVVFSIWDRFFGTYVDQAIGLHELSFGLPVTAEESPAPRFSRSFFFFWSRRRSRIS